MAFTINSDELMNASTAIINNVINSSQRVYDKASTVKIPSDFTRKDLVNNVVQEANNIHSKAQEVRSTLDTVIKKLVATGQLKSDPLKKFDIPDIDTLRQMSREQLMEYNLTADEINEVIRQLAEEGLVPQEWTSKNIGEAMASSSEKYDISTILPLSILIFRATNTESRATDPNLFGDNTGNNVFGFTRYLPEGQIQSESALVMPDGRSFEEYMDISVYTIAARLSNRDAIASDTVNNYYHDWFLTGNNWYPYSEGNGHQPGNVDSVRGAEIMANIMSRINTTTTTAVDVNSDPSFVNGEANSPAAASQVASVGTQTQAPVAQTPTQPAQTPAQPAQTPTQAETPAQQQSAPAEEPTVKVPKSERPYFEDRTQTPSSQTPTQTETPTQQQPAQTETPAQQQPEQTETQAPAAQTPAQTETPTQQQPAQAETQTPAQTPTVETPTQTAETSEPTSSGQTYTVRSGDTLGKIAQRYGTTVEDLARINGITDPNVIGVDQQLIIPNGQYTSSGQTYTVQGGDTLGKIAQRYGTTVEALAKLNGIADPNVIGIDQVLILPENNQGN